MALPAEKRRHTVDEYLRIERDSTDKHEFHDGEILAMSGVSYNHSLIASNVTREIGVRLKGKSCRVLESNLRVRVVPGSRYVYPDATVICGKPQFDPADSKSETVINPRVVIEVLSDSTEGYDRGDKFAAYRQIESLDEYVLVSQNGAGIESFLRQSAGDWLFTAYSGLQSSLQLRSLKIEVPLAEIYSGVEFPPPKPPPPERTV